MIRLATILAVFLWIPAVCHAHFLWIVANPPEKNGKVEAYFSESAAPDDAKLLEKFHAMKIVTQTRGRDGAKKQEIELKPVDDALVGELPNSVSSPLTAQQTYGVLTRGGEAFLLKYYAKAFPSALPGNWAAVNDAELAAFEVTPQIDGDEIVFTVTFLGKPAAGDQVTVEGPGLAEKIQGDADAEGKFRCKLPERGLYSVRARHTENTEGKLGDDSYKSVRHYATVSLPYTPAKAVAAAHAVPDLPRGVTSFGAAILGTDLYVYGGHFGTPHHYSSEGQSNELWKISLTDPNAAWQTIATGPKLTGLAMVAYDGKLYRLGGFTAKNAEKDAQELVSQGSFASFDPASGKWTDLPPLPEPRSSHDAAVLDGKLYVVGGWNMAGSGDTTWHKTAWVCDLTKPELTWSEIAAPPFLRRALSLAAHQGKLYVLGGMQESGGPTPRVDVYDPASKSWSEGPSLIGNGMEGFGNSSFANKDQLFASTISGSLQKLYDDNRWEVVGQLHHPRFFHRQLPTANGELLFVGGASMATGKTTAVEVLKTE